jgi:hypothetical protein
VQLANLDDSHLKAKKQFAADRKAVSASVTASLTDYFSCSTGLESENSAHTGYGHGNENRINGRRSTRSLNSNDLHSSVRSEGSKDNLTYSEAFCVGSSVYGTGTGTDSDPNAHSRHTESASPAASNTNKDSDRGSGGESDKDDGGDMREEGRILGQEREGVEGEGEEEEENREGGEEKGGEEKEGEDNESTDVDRAISKSGTGASHRDADVVKSPGDTVTCFSFLTSSEEKTADTTYCSSDSEGGRERGGESSSSSADVGEIDPTHSLGKVLSPRSSEDAGEKEVVVDRPEDMNTALETEDLPGERDFSGGHRADSIALPGMAPLPTPPLPSLPIPIPQKAKKQTRFQLGDTEQIVQPLSISAPLSVSSCMASPTGSPSPGGDRGDGWSEMDHALFTKVHSMRNV